MVRSVLGTEGCAFADAFDQAFALRTTLYPLLRLTLPIHMPTDSKSLLDTLFKESVTTEKRLAIYLQAIRQAYSQCKISNVAFVRSEHDPDDSLTKVKKIQALQGAITNNKLDHPFDQ